MRETDLVTQYAYLFLTVFDGFNCLQFKRIAVWDTFLTFTYVTD